jgi:MFS family permease
LYVCRGPLSDWLGRRTAFLAATLLFLATSIPCILAPSIYLLIVFRALQGLAVAAYGACAVEAELCTLHCYLVTKLNAVYVALAAYRVHVDGLLGACHMKSMPVD